MSDSDARVEAAAEALLGPSWQDQREKFPIAWENALRQARAAIAAADAVQGDDCPCIYTEHCDERQGCRLKAGATVNDGGGISRVSPSQPADDRRMVDRIVAWLRNPPGGADEVDLSYAIRIEREFGGSAPSEGKSRG